MIILFFKKLEHIPDFYNIYNFIYNTKNLNMQWSPLEVTGIPNLTKYCKVSILDPEKKSYRDGFKGKFFNKRRKLWSQAILDLNLNFDI